MTSLSSALAAGPIALDGGLATQLEAQGNDLTGQLWSAALLQTNPDTIVAAHRAFIAAGAQVIETATYQATFEGFARAGIDRDEAGRLMRKASDLARGAVDEVADDGVPRWVAASVGPYGAMLADGSEYTGAYGLTAAQLREFHLPRLAVLTETAVDVLAFETIPNAAEVEAVVAATDEFDVPVWISLSIADGATRAGEPLDEAFAIAASGRNVMAIGMNCSSPEDVTAAMPLAAAHGLPVVVYPNSGEGWDAVNRTWTGTAGFDSDLVHTWVEGGARLVGGCCRVTPQQISVIAEAL